MRLEAIIASGFLFTAIWMGIAAGEAPQGSLRKEVEVDWTAQEKRSGREPHSPEAVREAFRRAELLLKDLRAIPEAPDFEKETADLQQLRSEVRRAGSFKEKAGLVLYQKIRSITRAAALKNPLIASKPILFMKRRRFICQMLHEYLGYYYDYGDIAGGGVYLLEQPGHSLKVRDLVGGRLPRGNYTTLSLSFDAQKIYFAFAPRAEKKPNYYSPERRCFHIYTMDAGGENLRQITFGADDDFDPCPLPEGGLLFMSTRRGGFTRCNNPWEPLPAHTLHRLDAALKDVRTLSFHETSEWHPSVLHDGRVVYIRWDYVDRSAANFHGLWIANPDGTNPKALFGNYTKQINACYQPRAIPGSNRIVFIAGAHHANVGGSLVIFDPDKAALDPVNGQDRLDAVELLTPEVCFPEAPGWPKSYFHSPWPLSENYFLVAFSFEPLPGMGSGVEEDTKTGLYYFDRFGNLELLYRDEGYSSMYPIPLDPRAAPPVVVSTVDSELGDEGEFILTDVGRSHFPMPKDRTIRELRVFQVLPKSSTHVANEPRIGYANAESARMLLGSVPVEADGSAYFRAPARKPLYFQAVDESGRAVQSMRSVTYLQPGERRSCIGCHEPGATVPVNNPQQPLASIRKPSTIQPGPDGTRPVSYPRLIQPILERNCVRCHDGTEGPGKSDPVLTADREKSFSKSYNNLKPYIRWYEWGGQSIEPIVTRPGRVGADESRLTTILGDATHQNQLNMPDADWRSIYLWLDANAPFFGTYEREEQLAQQSGQSVSPPKLQ